MEVVRKNGKAYAIRRGNGANLVADLDAQLLKELSATLMSVLFAPISP